MHNCIGDKNGMRICSVYQCSKELSMCCPAVLLINGSKMLIESSAHLRLLLKGDVLPEIASSLTIPDVRW